jgi:hypothetical protein
LKTGHIDDRSSPRHGEEEKEVGMAGSAADVGDYDD